MVADLLSGVAARWIGEGRFREEICFVEVARFIDFTREKEPTLRGPRDGWELCEALLRGRADLLWNEMPLTAPASGMLNRAAPALRAKRRAEIRSFHDTVFTPGLLATSVPRNPLLKWFGISGAHTPGLSKI